MSATKRRYTRYSRLYCGVIALVTAGSEVDLPKRRVLSSRNLALKIANAKREWANARSVDNAKAAPGP